MKYARYAPGNIHKSRSTITMTLNNTPYNTSRRTLYSRIPANIRQLQSDQHKYQTIDRETQRIPHRPHSPDPEVNCAKKDGKLARLDRVTFVATAIRSDSRDPK